MDYTFCIFVLIPAVLMFAWDCAFLIPYSEMRFSPNLRIITECPRCGDTEFPAKMNISFYSKTRFLPNSGSISAVFVYRGHFLDIPLINERLASRFRDLNSSTTCSPHLSYHSQHDTFCSHRYVCNDMPGELEVCFEQSLDPKAIKHCYSIGRGKQVDNKDGGEGGKILRLSSSKMPHEDKDDEGLWAWILWILLWPCRILVLAILANLALGMSLFTTFFCVFSSSCLTFIMTGAY